MLLILSRKKSESAPLFFACTKPLHPAVMEHYYYYTYLWLIKLHINWPLTLLVELYKLAGFFFFYCL